MQESASRRVFSVLPDDPPSPTSSQQSPTAFASKGEQDEKPLYLFRTRHGTALSLRIRAMGSDQWPYVDYIYSIAVSGTNLFNGTPRNVFAMTSTCPDLMKGQLI